MELISRLKELQALYQKGGNLLEGLRKEDGAESNDPAAVAVSYDFQTGSYIKDYAARPELYASYAAHIAAVIDRYAPPGAVIAEAGVGEGTTFANVLPRLRSHVASAYGFDISWSRVRLAREYARKKKVSSDGLIVGDLFASPFVSESIDVLYTSNSIEPNGGRTREALQELLRITRQWLILFEPAYDLAGAEARARMQSHGYITDLIETAQELNCEIVEHGALGISLNALNPTGCTVIRKKPTSERSASVLACPVTHADLLLAENAYFCPDSLLAYPIVGEVPCLRAENAIVATHFQDDFLRLVSDLPG